MPCTRMIQIREGAMFRNRGRFYTQGSSRLDMYDCFKGINDIYIWTRLYDISDEETDNYSELNFNSSKKTFHICGIVNPPKGYMGYIITFFQRFTGLKKLLKGSALIFCQPMTVSSWMMWYFFRNNKQIFIGRCIGDPEGLKDTHKPLKNQIAWMMNHVSLKYYKKCALQTWVSKELENKYAQKGVPSVIFHDFLIYKSEMCNSPRLSDDGFFRIIFTGRLSEEKGIVDLVNALGILRNPSILLDIIGNGREESHIRSVIKRLHLDSSVRLIGYCEWGEKLFEYMKNADCLVLPSYNEGLGMVLLEAMANGTTVIASRIGGIPDIVTDGYNGLLFEAGDVKALAERINELYSDRKKLLELSINAITVARDNSRDIQLEKFKGAYMKYVYDKLQRL